MPAFVRGLAAGADGLELDVRLSRDGIAVVHHDAALDRTTTATGLVSARTAVELASIDATTRLWPREPSAGVPTLEEVVRSFPTARIIIEIKQASWKLTGAVIQVVNRAGAAHRVCLGSYSLRAMMAARRRDTHVATSAAKFEVRMALYRTRCGCGLGRPPYAAFQVPEVAGTTRIVSPRFVRKAHEAGVAVQVWTVDEPADIRRLLDWGVDAIITDRPDVASAIVRERFGESVD
jgi:glycerophosphoryl diester phosphodiesterase